MPNTYPGAAAHRSMWALIVAALCLIPMWRMAALSWQEDSAAATDEVMLPPGHGSELTREVCSRCHSLQNFTGLRTTRAEWDDMIRLMNAYGAELREEEVEAIGGYLAEVFSPESPPLVDANRASKGDFAKLPGLPARQAAKLIERRARKGRFVTLKEVQDMLGAEVFASVRGYLVVK